MTINLLHRREWDGISNPTELIQTSIGQVSSEYTQCARGICPMSNGVCCGNPINDKQYCCPSEYPICDTTLNMCRKFSD